MSEQRERLLASVSLALSDVRASARPLPELIDLPQSAEDAGALAERFCRELSAIDGHAAIVRDETECSAAVRDYLRSRSVHSVAVQSAPLAAQVAAGLEDFDIAPAAGRHKSDLERCDASLLEAPSLLADTGAAIVVLENGSDRVLPYLPRTCVIVARMSALHSTMSPAGVACIRDAAKAGTRGEALIVAGPSRSADIEKILVLGAHGPQAVAIFIIEAEGV